MSVTFRKLNHVEQGSKACVFGYIRCIESSLSADFNNNIPIAIKQICLLYYLPAEQFGNHGKNTKISSKNGIKCNALCPERIPNAVYGTCKIEPYKYPNCTFNWIFRFKYHKKYYVSLGICSSNTQNLDKWCFNGLNKVNYYSWFVTKGYKRDHINIHQKPVQYADKVLYGHKVIKMSFNVKKKELRFYELTKKRREIDLGIAHNNIDTEKSYYMAVSLMLTNTAFELLHFNMEWN